MKEVFGRACKNELEEKIVITKSLTDGYIAIETPIYENDKENGLSIDKVWNMATELRGAEHCGEILYITEDPINYEDVFTQEGYFNYERYCFIANGKEYWYRDNDLVDYAWQKLGYPDEDDTEND